MAQEIKMPKLGMDMTDGTLINWIKNVGDTIKPGDVIAEIETDKTTVEVESEVEGTILELIGSPGDVIAVGAVMGYVGAAGEAAPAGEQAAPQAAPQTEAAPAQESQPAFTRPEPAPASADGGSYPGGVKASPVARNIASQRGIDLRQVSGSGPGGRIVKADVESFTPGQAQPAQAEPAAPAFTPGVRGVAAAAFYPELPSGPDVEVSDTSNLRKRIATRMVESKQHVPHFYVTSEIDVSAMLQLRKQLNDSLSDPENKISVNDLIVKATALNLREFPNLNSHFYGDKIVRHKRINIGIAVALPNGGLMNVVVKDADKLALGTLAAQSKAMIARARDGKVKPDDVQGSTFSVSNLGAYDVEDFVAIINPPEAAILAVGTAKKVPVVLEDGTLGIGQRMRLTISVDHRISDGAEGALFLQKLKELLENPMRLLL